MRSTTDATTWVWRSFAALLLLSLIPALVWLPYLVPVQPDVVSTAALVGYNNSVAFMLTVAWVLLIVTVFAARGFATTERNVTGTGHIVASGVKTSARWTGGWIDIGFWVVASLIVYFPLFLARGGPFIEDHIILNALHRMEGGQQPYVDFEFLYGPLMIRLPRLWMQVFGFSLPSFYAYVALIEASFYGALAAVIYRWLPDRKVRWMAMVLVAAFAANVLVGPNWSASRRLLGIVALVVAAAGPRSLAMALIAGVLAGLQAAYSHDFGAATVAGLMCIYGLLAVRGDVREALSKGTLACVVALLVWFMAAVGSLGMDGFGAYISEVVFLSSRFSAGEAGFRFYWTINSLAIFAMIGCASVALGLGVANREERPAFGDFLLAGGLAFAMVGMKSGLNRADMFHLNAPLIALVLGLLFVNHRTLFRLPVWGERLATTAVAVTALTYAFGLLPAASYLAQGWLRGLEVTLSQKPVLELPFETRAPIIETWRADPNPEILDLAEYLADPGRRSRPVLFYASAWALGKHVGVYKQDFVNDDFLYAEERGELVRTFLEQNLDALVIIQRPSYQRLYGLANPDAVPEHRERFRPSMAKSIASWLSTVHYREVAVETVLKEQRWRRTVGAWLAERYWPIAEFGDYLVLSRY